MCYIFIENNIYSIKGFKGGYRTVGNRHLPTLFTRLPNTFRCLCDTEFFICYVSVGKALLFVLMTVIAIEYLVLLNRSLYFI